MRKATIRRRRREKGQAFVEYVILVLFPKIRII